MKLGLHTNLDRDKVPNQFREVHCDEVKLLITIKKLWMDASELHTILTILHPRFASLRSEFDSHKNQSIQIDFKSILD